MHNFYTITDKFKGDVRYLNFSNNIIEKGGTWKI